MSAKYDVSALIYKIVWDGCETSYRHLFRIMYPPLKAFAFSILKSKEQAEEVASDVMITLWRDKHKLLEINNIMVYGYVIAKNRSLNLLKARNGREISIDEIEIDIVFNAPNPEQILITDELRKNLQQAMQCLPPKCKMVYRLVKEDGLSYKEVAEILSISVKTVDAHLVTAVKKISESIKSEYNLA